jgi:thioredoxin-like negative regulator of GroEL
MLQALLHDSDPEIRLYASIRVSGLEDEMGRAIHAARAATETSASEVDAWRRLVLACSDYISSGLLDEATATQYLVQAEEAYHVASQLQPGQGDLAMMLGRACQAIRHFDPAREYFAHAAHARDAALAIDARIGLMEVAFAQRSLADVKAYAALAAPEMAPDDPRRPVVEWWAQAA